MARSFDGAADCLSCASAPVTAVPLTMAAWFATTDGTTEKAIINIAYNAANGSDFSLNAAASGKVTASAWAGSGTTRRTASSTASYATDGTWQHAAGTFVSTTSRYAFLNGTKGANAGSVSVPSSLDSVGVGAVLKTSTFYYMNGAIAEAGIWNVVLADAEVALLASGMCPLDVRPRNLVAYWPLLGQAGATGGEPSWVGYYPLSDTDDPAIVDHPRIIFTRRPQIFLPSSAVAVVSYPLYRASRSFQHMMVR